jgi:hypothetical protein
MRAFRFLLVMAFFFSACGSPPELHTVIGPAGPAGSNGTNGTNGHNALAAFVSGGFLSCAAGGTTLIVGTDSNDDGVLQPTEITGSAVICDGANGHDGQDGEDGKDAPPTAFTPVALVDPCGDKPGVYDEVFVRLQNGTLIASFSDDATGTNTHFAVLTAGSYVTTDGSHCYFSVDANGNLQNEHY